MWDGGGWVGFVRSYELGEGDRECLRFRVERTDNDRVGGQKD